MYSYQTRCKRKSYRKKEKVEKLDIKPQVNLHLNKEFHSIGNCFVSKKTSQCDIKTLEKEKNPFR